jgi:hypothetical protein
MTTHSHSEDHPDHGQHDGNRNTTAVLEVSRLTNLPAPRKIGFSANRRLLDVQRLSHNPADGTTTL